MIDREFQLFILQQAAPTYPGHAFAIWDTLVAAAPGDTPAEKWDTVVNHLHALQAFGYVSDATRQGCDGRVSVNQAFFITEQGLLEVGVDILHPDPYRELREALFEQAQALRELSEGQKRTLKKTLLQLPLDSLEHLRDKALDALLSAILP